MNEQMPPAPVAPKTPLIAPWLLIILIVVLLAGGGYLGWWYYSNHKITTPTGPTKNLISTADWQTWDVNSIGVGFRYPKEWVDLKSAGFGGGLFAVVENKSLPIGGCPIDGSVSVDFYKNKDNSKFKKEFVGDLTTIGGLKIQKYSVQIDKQGPNNLGMAVCNDNDKAYLYLIKNGSDEYSISVKGYKNVTSEDYEIAETIVTTFQFTAAVSTADWKTYTNSAIGYSFKYPKEWVVMAADQVKGQTATSKESIDFTSSVPNMPAGNSFVVKIVNDSIDNVKTTREKNAPSPNFSKITIASKTAYKSTLLQGIEGKIQELLIDIAPKTIKIFAEGKTIDNIDTILSTFQFSS